MQKRVKRESLKEALEILVALPTDLRRLVMMKLSYSDMYAVYEGLGSESFRRWCDEQFWDYAHHHPRTPTMTHSRWRFFSCAYAREIIDNGYGVMFGNPTREKRISRIHFEPEKTEEVVVICFSKFNLNFGHYLFQLYGKLYNTIPIVSIDKDDARLIQIRFEKLSCEDLAGILYHLFESGLGYWVVKFGGAWFHIK